MVSHPSKYQWSSYHSNALGKEDSLIQPHIGFTYLGKTIGECQLAYQEFFKESLDQKVLNELRESTNKGLIFGNNEFKSVVSQQLNCRVEFDSWGGNRKSRKSNQEL